MFGSTPWPRGTMPDLRITRVVGCNNWEHNPGLEAKRHWKQRFKNKSTQLRECTELAHARQCGDQSVHTLPMHIHVAAPAHMLDTHARPAQPDCLDSNNAPRSQDLWHGCACVCGGCTDRQQPTHATHTHARVSSISEMSTLQCTTTRNSNAAREC